MADLLTAMGWLLGVFAVSFTLSGVIGLMQIGEDQRRKNIVADPVDAIILSGLLASLAANIENFPKRPDDRRQLFIAALCAVGSAGCFLLRRMLT